MDKPIPFIALKSFIQQLGIFFYVVKIPVCRINQIVTKTAGIQNNETIMYGKVPLGLIESQFIHFVFDRKQMNQTIAQTIVNALGIV